MKKSITKNNTAEKDIIILCKGIKQYADETLTIAAKHGNFDLMNINTTLLLAESILRAKK